MSGAGLLVGTMCVIGPHIFSRPAEAYSHNGVLRVPGEVREDKASVEAHLRFLVPSCFLIHH